MNIFTYFRKKEIDTPDPAFYSKINEWKSWYEANVKSFHNYRVYNGSKRVSMHRHSLGMAKQVSEDMADLLLNEKVGILMSDAGTDAYVHNILKSAHFDTLGSEYQERKCASGTVAYIPYLDGIIDRDGRFVSGTVKIDYVDGDCIYPVTWENGQIAEVVFLFIKTYKRKKYANFQYHRIVDGEYVIENSVVECSDGAGKEIPVDKWKDIKPFENLAPAVHTGTLEPQFVIDKLNIVNNADADTSNPMGIALFGNAIDVLRSIDLKYDSYANEFTLGKKRIFVTPEMLTRSGDDQVFDTNDVVFYSLPEDYKGSDDKQGLLIESNMTLRVEEHSRAINDDLNLLSLKCGFGTQRYRFEDGEVKTATEVISENSDMYRSICKHELILRDALEDLCRIIARLGLVLGEDLKPDCDITISFDDSIIEDKSSEREQDRRDVSMGVMTKAEYRAKWYGETEEVAQGKLPAGEEGILIE